MIWVTKNNHFKNYDSMQLMIVKLTPQILSREQKEFHAVVAEHLLQIINNDPHF